MIRAIFDTNIVLSALLFPNGRLAWLRSAWENGLLVPVVSKEIIEELLRVLEYPKFKLSKEDRRELLADYLPYTEVIVIDKNQRGVTPVCRDKKDQMFLVLAYQSTIDYLISGDKDLLELNNVVEFKIQTAAQLKNHLI
ncbi:MAG: putative toxin-antitoxin system toxin component, PIN family [Thiohalomonadales bacterium]